MGPEKGIHVLGNPLGGFVRRLPSELFQGNVRVTHWASYMCVVLRVPCAMPVLERRIQIGEPATNPYFLPTGLNPGVLGIVLEGKKE